MPDEYHKWAAFRFGAQACREMMARFVEQGGDPVTAGSIRVNWNQSWGADPGRFTSRIPDSPFDCVE